MNYHQAVAYDVHLQHERSGLLLTRPCGVRPALSGLKLLVLCCCLSCSHGQGSYRYVLPPECYMVAGAENVTTCCLSSRDLFLVCCPVPTIQFTAVAQPAKHVLA